jgi:hypothetical protein
MTGKTKRRQRYLVILTAVFFLVCAGGLMRLWAKETMEVVKDKEKTTYVIGPKEEKPDEDKEKSWEMLRNMGIILDRRDRDGKRPDHNR